ncbi:MAG: ankyrin repeat domain-containing protein [Bacteroidia bacterium]
MTHVKIKNMKALLSTVILALLFVSCKQQSSTSETNNETQVEFAMDIHAAASTGNLEVIKQYINANVDLNKQDPFAGSTPLMTAITFNQEAIVKELIDAEVDLEAKNTDGATALHTAAWFGRIEMVQLLIDAKADKAAKNGFGATPRESVMVSFDEVKPIYEMMQQQLAPIGLTFDLAEIEEARPVIAMMLQ